MEPVEEPLSVALNPDSTPTTQDPRYVYIATLEIWEADEDSFSCAGRRFYWHGHGLSVGDKVRVTIERVPRNDIEDEAT